MPDRGTLESIRRQSLETIKSLRLPVNAGLPLLDEDLAIARSRDEVANRAMCIYITIAYAYGEPTSTIRPWLDGEGLSAHLTEQERRALYGGFFSRKPNSDLFKVRVQSLWALAWSLGLFPHLDLVNDCAETLRESMPALVPGAAQAWRDHCSLRPLAEILPLLDLGYCLHWAVRQSQLEQTPLPAGIHAVVAIERRRALEWLVCKEDWDDVPMDT
jgi:hypothetical protein